MNVIRIENFRHTCPCCEGSKTNSLTEMSLDGKELDTMTFPCITCDGEGTVDHDLWLDYRDAMDTWCKCGCKNGARYVDDNVSKECSKHHWVCRDCGKITQVG